MLFEDPFVQGAQVEWYPDASGWRYVRRLCCREGEEHRVLVARRAARRRRCIVPEAFIFTTRHLRNKDDRVLESETKPQSSSSMGVMKTERVTI